MNTTAFADISIMLYNDGDVERGLLIYNLLPEEVH